MYNHLLKTNFVLNCLKNNCKKNNFEKNNNIKNNYQQHQHYSKQDKSYIANKTNINIKSLSQRFE